MMTLDEMKLAVCEKLPELIEFRGDRVRWIDNPQLGHKVWDIHWPTEGLQVCHEAEKLLRNNQFHYARYDKELWNVLFPLVPYTGNLGYLGFIFVTANYEQRLESLCRVWWPERWS